MHVGKLLSVIDIILKEYDKPAMKRIKEIATNKKLANELNKIPLGDQYGIGQRIARELEFSESELKLSPSQFRIFKQIGGTKYSPHVIKEEFQITLRDELRLSEDQITAMKDLIQGTVGLYNALTELKHAFTYLKIAKDELNPGEAEVGVGIPPKRGFITLIKLRDEARDFDRALRAFIEVAGETIESPKLRVISSSWFEFFILAGPAAALLVAKTIERIVNLYKTKLEIEKLRIELGKQKVPEQSVLQPLKEHEKHFIENGLNELAESFLNENYKGKTTRKNELRTALRKAMLFMAKRIDHGFSIEVAVRKLEPPKRKRGEKQTQAQAKEMKAYKEQKKMAETINRLGYAVTELDPARKPILMLPPQEEPKRKTKKKVKVKVKKKTKLKVKKKAKVKVKKKTAVTGENSSNTIESDSN